jgi:hypothetical protein
MRFYLHAAVDSFGSTLNLRRLGATAMAPSTGQHGPTSIAQISGGTDRKKVITHTAADPQIPRTKAPVDVSRQRHVKMHCSISSSSQALGREARPIRKSNIVRIVEIPRPHP